MKESAWLKVMFIMTVAASLLLLCGCAGKDAVDDAKIAEESEEEAVPEGEYEISTTDIESDLDLSELEGIDDELDELNW